MTRTLFTFLGRVPKGEHGYRKTRYDFGDGKPDAPVAFFGWPLHARVGARRLVILGTAGSMWDHLFEGDISFGEEAEEARVRLLEATEHMAVTADMLLPLQALLSQRLGCEARLVLIPYCRDEGEQVRLLGILADHVDRRDAVHIDVTHGFRHLPMLALVAALHLRVVRDARIEGLWYGAYDPDTNEAPVHNLVGLLRLADWVEALHTYDKDGDYGSFAALLGPGGDLLARAAFFERTSNPVKAREALAGWASRADRYPAEDQAAALFREELERRIDWYREPDRAAWERALAFRYLEQGDFVRAAIYGLEATVSAEVMRSGGKEGDYDDREAGRAALKDKSDGFRTLNHLRNALAHGVRPFNKNIQKALKDEHTLRNTLKSLLVQLLRPEVSRACP